MRYKPSAAEYVALDRAAKVRSEYYDDEIVAMSGGSAWHSAFHINLAVAVQDALGGGSRPGGDLSRCIHCGRRC